jgi:hypothetical protein
MANSDTPKGFWPHGRVLRTTVAEAGSACYPGDFVSLASDGQVDPTSAGATIYGLCLSYASAAGQDVLLSTDPEQLYAAQGDETEFTAQTVIGNNCDILATAGSSTYKTSRQEIDSSTIGTSAAQVTIVGLEKVAGNGFGTNAKVIVRVNEHQVNKDAFAGI